MTIHYDNTKRFEYAYVERRDYASIPDRFLRNTLIALDYLYKTNALTIRFIEDEKVQVIDIIDELVDNPKEPVHIVYAEKNTYASAKNIVTFYDTHGVVFRKNHKKRWFRRNRGFNSPVALLSHELIHCYNEIYDNADYLERKANLDSRGKKIDMDGHDLSFPNAEEVFVIKMTNQVAHRLGEDRRSNYGRSYYPTQSVLSTKRKRRNLT